MRYELSDYEWTAIKPMLPDKPRETLEQPGLHRVIADFKHNGNRRGCGFGSLGRRTEGCDQVSGVHARRRQCSTVHF
jgi:transposase